MAFDADKIKRRLYPRRVEYYDEINSTNAKLRDEIERGTAKRGDVVIAGRQSAGRGRHGKSFSSPEGGIYFSFAANNTDGALATVAAGAAVANALRSLGYAPTIKWVNDVLLFGRKVCGILAEAVFGTTLCVVGIGINLHAATLPNELSGIASALDEVPSAVPSAEELVACILEEYDRLDALSKEELVAEYKSYLAFLGGEIEIKSSGEICLAKDVTTDGELVAVRKTGERIKLNSGEISIYVKDLKDW